MNRLSTKPRNLPTTIFLSAAIVLSTMWASPARAQSTEGGPNADPKAVMMYNLGITAYRQGSTDAAVIFFKRACDIDANLADAQYNLAVIYQSQKRYKEAIPRFEEVLRIKPNDPDAHFQLGVALQDSARYQDARQHFASIPPNNAHFAEAQHRLGQLNSLMAGAVGQQSGTYPAAQPPSSAAGGPATPTLQPPIAADQPATVQTQVIQPLPTNQPQALSAASPPQTAQPGQPQMLGAPDTTFPQTNHPAGGDLAVQQPASPADNQPASPAPENGLAPLNSSPVPALANCTLNVIATGFNAPAGLTFDHSGNLFVANFLTNSIERITPEGTRTQFTSGSNLRGPIGLIADERGNLYVANYNGGTIAKINPAGVSSIIATGFKKPYYLTLDKDGNLYVSQQEDNSIVRITLPRATAAKMP